jgi:hypothetical protein
MSSIAGRGTGESGAQWCILPMFLLYRHRPYRTLRAPSLNCKEDRHLCESIFVTTEGGGDALEQSPQPRRALTMRSRSARRYCGLCGKAANNGRRCRA